jgi:prepilin-type processing-associated H-X9-DG protein
MLSEFLIPVYVILFIPCCALLVWYIILLYKTFCLKGSEHRWSKRKIIFNWIVWMISTSVFVLISWQSIITVQGAVYFANCRNYFMQHGCVFHSYHDKYGHLPPACLLNDQGQPGFGWRVIIMPIQEEQEMYNRFHLNESWNSAHNQAVCESRPKEYGFNTYQCPADKLLRKNDTSIVMPIGPETISDGPNTRMFSDVTDGTAHTIMLGEMSQSGIHWMEPRDLKTDEMSFKINDRTRPSFRSMHPGRVNVLFVDGAVRAIKDDIDPKVLKAAITISGGEPPGNFDD